MKDIPRNIQLEVEIGMMVNKQGMMEVIGAVERSWGGRPRTLMSTSSTIGKKMREYLPDWQGMRKNAVEYRGDAVEYTIKVGKRVRGERSNLLLCAKYLSGTSLHSGCQCQLSRDYVGGNRYVNCQSRSTRVQG